MSESIRDISPQQVQQTITPTDLVPLPSNGKIYPPGSALHNAESIAIRSMTAKDEDILTSRAYLKSGAAINALVKSCVTDKSIDVDNMISGDRNAVIIGIRITGYGDEYNVEMSCPSCAEKIKKSVSLSELPIKRFPEGVEPVEPGRNEFSFSLPISKKNVTFKLMTGQDEQELIKLLDRRQKSNLPDELVTTRLKIQVLSVDGERDPGKLSNIIMGLSARDSRSLRNYMDKINPGVELKTSFECQSCNYMDEGVEVPLGTEFFWPSA